MKEEGQVFTSDMIFALILVAALLSVSSQAYDIASGEIKSYTTRFSLERVTNDTADVLVKTSGDPIKWETAPSDLRTLGLAELNPNNKPIANNLDSNKLAVLASEITENDWNPYTENSDQAIMEFFGTKNFEVTLKDGEEELWKIWPGWKSGSSSGAENSVEVATVNRIVYSTPLAIKGRSPPLTLDPPASQGDNLEFFVKSGELDTHDWYIYVENENQTIPNKLALDLNHSENDASQGDYNFGDSGSRRKIPGYVRIDNATAGSLENGGTPLQGDNWNFISAHVTSTKEVPVYVYVVIIPPGMDPNGIPKGLEKRGLVLRVKMWR